MKRITIVLTATLMLALLTYAHSRTLKPNSPPKPTTQTVTAKKTALVKQLPAGVEGVELKGNSLRLKEGYKFVPEPNKSVSIARIKGGTKISGTWDCACSKDGACGVSVGPNGLDCLMETCKGSCTLKVTIGGQATRVIMFAR